MQSSSLFAWIALVLCLIALRMERDQEQRLAPGDQVRITVADRPELTTNAALDTDGAISLPHLGRVRLAGLSRMLAESYVAERMLADGAVGGLRVNVQVIRLADAAP